MRTFAVMAAATGLALVLETTLLPLLPFGLAVPDFLLVLCVYLGLHQHSAGGAVGAFVLGYLRDSASGSASGLNAFAMSLVFLLVYLTSRRLWVDNITSQVVLVFLASVVKTAAVMVLLAVFLVPDGLWRTLLRALPVQAVLAAAVAPPVFALLASARRLQEEDEG